MKANEAPEKIYMNPSFWEPDNVSIAHFSKKQFDFNTGIEYTRTDAFIEKVLDYIENNIYDHYDGDNEYGICGGYVKKEEFIKKTLGEINTGDVRLSNPDYDFIEFEMFDKELFDKKQLSKGIRCFGFGSYRYGCNYCMNKPPYTYKYNFLDDEDAGTLCADYFFFLKKEQELFNEMLETTGEPVYYIDDSKLNVDLKYGDILLYKNLKYGNSIEFLELQAGDYGHTIERCIAQEDQFYEWLTSKEDKEAHVDFYGKKIIVSPEYSQTQNSNAIMITTVSAHEGSLYKVNIDMRELAKRVGELNNDLYKRLRSVYEKYDEIKKAATYKDWDGNIINAI